MMVRPFIPLRVLVILIILLDRHYQLNMLW